MMIMMTVLKIYRIVLNIRMIDVFYVKMDTKHKKMEKVVFNALLVKFLELNQTNAHLVTKDLFPIRLELNVFNVPMIK